MVVMASCSSEDHTVRLNPTFSIMNTVSQELVPEQVPSAAKRGKLIYTPRERRGEEEVLR